MSDTKQSVIPPDMQKQIGEVVVKKEAKLALTINLHCKEYRLAILQEALTEITQPLLERIGELEKQWKEYCNEYDLMLARWKDEKADIAGRCGKPWENGMGLEPWCAADDLMKEKNALQHQLTTLQAKVKEMEVQEVYLSGLIEQANKALDTCRYSRGNCSANDDWWFDWKEVQKAKDLLSEPSPTGAT